MRERGFFRRERCLVFPPLHFFLHLFLPFPLTSEPREVDREVDPYGDFAVLAEHLARSRRVAAHFRSVAMRAAARERPGEKTVEVEFFFPLGFLFLLRELRSPPAFFEAFHDLGRVFAPRGKLGETLILPVGGWNGLERASECVPCSAELIGMEKKADGDGRRQAGSVRSSEHAVRIIRICFLLCRSPSSLPLTEACFKARLQIYFFPSVSR